MFECCRMAIPGCYEIQSPVIDDARGRFVKVFCRDAFLDRGLEIDFPEEYYSTSRQGVIRGMHFQTPPMDHAKLVFCTRGEVFDVVLDLRVGSPTYGKTEAVQLSADKGNCIYVPKGLAHGFCVISELATLVYKASTLYSPAHDTGILWNSLGVAWPTSDPVLSDRDRQFIQLADFESPFVYG